MKRRSLRPRSRHASIRFLSLVIASAVLAVGPLSVGGRSGILPGLTTAMAANDAELDPQDAGAWKSFTPKSGVFTALMPGKVSESDTDVADVQGKQYRYAATQPGQWSYTVGYLEFGEKFYADMERQIPDSAKRDKMLLDKFVDGITAASDFKNVTPKLIKVDGLTGYDLIAPPSDELAFGQMRCFISGRRVFFLFIMQFKGNESAANRKKFLESVRVKGRE